MMISWRRCTKEELCGVKKREWMSGMERFKKQVSASCKRLRFSAESMVSHLERNLLPIFLFLFYTFFSRKSKERRNSSIPITFLSIFLSLGGFCGRLFVLSHSLEVCCVFVLMAMCTFFACNLCFAALVT